MALPEERLVNRYEKGVPRWRRRVARRARRDALRAARRERKEERWRAAFAAWRGASDEALTFRLERVYYGGLLWIAGGVASIRVGERWEDEADAIKGILAERRKSAEGESR